MDYKTTVFLPKTNFAMKANLAQRELSFLQYWQEIDLYQNLRNQSGTKKKFILHLGPPYANGNIHIGHAFTTILKDVVVKTYQMLGYDAPLVPGWDCHGLPIEWKIEESYRQKGINKDEVPPLELRAECRAFADKWMKVQSPEFQRLGIIADWKNPYVTMDFASEAKIVEELGTFLLNGSLYRGLKPVLWSVVEKTALAEAEVEYKEHVSDSIYVRFPVTHSPLEILQGGAVVIWTTTPWTLPGNRAIAYGEDFDYVVIEVKENSEGLYSGDRLLVVKDLLENFVNTIGLQDYTVMATFKGKELHNTRCAHPLRGSDYKFDVPLLPGDHVTIEAGTGLVHTAPGHGIEDFALGQKYDLELPQTVAGDGRYYDHVPLVAGQHIFKVNPVIIEALKANKNLVWSGKISHSYPHSWRSKAPLIYRATAQWFISMDSHNLRKTALKAIDEVTWIPTQGRNRIRSMIEDRPDWCISRQRSWGTPLTLFVHKETGEVLRDAKIHARIVEAVRQEGGDAWYSHDAGYFLGSDYDPTQYDKIMDSLDVWFDSGCTYSYVLKSRKDLSWPADLYLEGSDQHRGWFQSSLLESCNTTGQAPYRQVLTHGFLLDEKGYKMSKSQGNVVAPETIIQSMGADLLRLWTVSADYSEDMRIGPDVLKYQEDIYRRLRNTLRYLLGSLADQETASVDHAGMPPLEQYILHRLAELDQLMRSCAKEFDFMGFYAALHHFCTVDLSAFYFDIRKDCLYCDALHSQKRQATLTVMDHLFTYLTRWLAPVLSFTAEEAYLERYGTTGNSIHLQTFLTPPNSWYNLKLAENWQIIRDVRRVVTGALEVERAAKTIGSSLQAGVTVYVTLEIATVIKDLDLAELAIASTASLIVAEAPPGAFTLEDVKGFCCFF